MKILVWVFCLILLSGQVVALAVERQKPVIKVSASVTTRIGAPREFHGPAGTVAWSPCLPLYRGDVLKLSYSVSGPRPSIVSVSVDGKPVANLRKEPWTATVGSANLSIGRHLAKADLRFMGTPIMYSISEFPFYIQAPPSAVKGVVESLTGDIPDSAAQPEIAIPASFVPPAESSVDDGFVVTLCSLDTDAGTSLKQGQPVHIDKPTAFLVSGPGLDRWAYVVIRDGRQIAGAGPISPSVYLLAAPQAPGQSGFLPGKIVLRAWGVTSNAMYSRPVQATLIVE